MTVFVKIQFKAQFPEIKLVIFLVYPVIKRDKMKLIEIISQLN